MAVALSGGVDSLCSMLILHAAGHELFALHGRFLHGRNSSAEDGLAEICSRLRVPLHFVDLEGPFFRSVIMPFAGDFFSGRTPNPCARCNRAIKFGALLGAARSLGADRLATGHYARVCRDPFRRRAVAPGYTLVGRALDSAKDQSYFLSLVPAEILPSLLMPLSGMPKAVCRQYVRSRGFFVPLEKESHDICFVRGSYQSYLLGLCRELGWAAPPGGPVLLDEGGGRPRRQIGRHTGLFQHTEGQRRGLNIAWSEPLYVIGKDIGRNALIVGRRSRLRMGLCHCGEVNFFVSPRDWPELVYAKFRYGAPLAPARAEFASGRLAIRPLRAQFPSAPGQVAAIYDGAGFMLGAGVVERTEYGETE